MGFQASHRYARVSARKIRPLADLVRGKYADEALDILRYQPQRGARILEKVIQSALGNAQDPDQNRGGAVNVDQLVVAKVVEQADHPVGLRDRCIVAAEDLFETHR